MFWDLTLRDPYQQILLCVRFDLTCGTIRHQRPLHNPSSKLARMLSIIMTKGIILVNHYIICGLYEAIAHYDLLWTYAFVATYGFLFKIKEKIELATMGCDDVSGSVQKSKESRDVDFFVTEGYGKWGCLFYWYLCWIWLCLF